MNLRSFDARRLSRIFWVLSVTAILVWSLVPSYEGGWDLSVYKAAVLSLRAGHDPYADAMAVQKAYQLDPRAYQPGMAIPYSYVYSPATLPLLRAIGKMPLGLSGTLYWGLYWICAGLTLWAGMQFFRKQESSVFALLAPVAIFFPGMIEADTLFCGNVAILLYGVVLCAALAGWKRGRWGWFHAAVLLAGCCKAPMLSLLIVPVLSARRQWLPALATGTLGVTIFLMQPVVWPSLFHSYLQAVDLQFRFNRDFGVSPAGLLANALFFHVPYRISSFCGYLVYAVPVAAVLFYFSRWYLAGRITLQQWAPLLLVGAILLNPRLMEYDLMPITLPLALLLWRFLSSVFSRAMTLVAMFAVFVAGNIAGAAPYRGLGNSPGKMAIGLMLPVAFAAGAWTIRRELRGQWPAHHGKPARKNAQGPPVTGFFT